jgi:hypothetical protein
MKREVDNIPTLFAMRSRKARIHIPFRLRVLLTKGHRLSYGVLQIQILRHRWPSAIYRGTL